MRAWYTDAAHGDLARHRPAFPAIRDLLEQGTTSALPMRPPAVSRAPHLPDEIEREPIALLPSEEQLLATAIGSGGGVLAAPRKPSVEIDVVHGHLAFASYPVVVGHYVGDTLNGTEEVLDRRQSGRISKRRKLGLHPGQIGAFDVHLSEDEQPCGSVIVGLGSISDLTGGKLQKTLQLGFLALAAAMEEEEAKGDCGWQGADPSPSPRGVSCVLIGTGEGVIATSDCIIAMLRAMQQANRLLEDRAFERLEIIEIIEQRAIGAWHAIAKRLERSEFKDAFRLDRPIRLTKGGQQRIGPDHDPSWWTPVTITSADDEAEGAHPAGTRSRSDRRALKYVAIAGRARAEASLIASRRSLVDRYVDRITRRQVEEGDQSAARTLFELLWPNRLKEQSLDDRPVRLILDESSAALPWEMMDDRRPWTAAGEDDADSGYGPPVTRFGVIRQLISMNFREEVRGVGGRKALVIGDPRGEKTPLKELPGAQEEAKAVAAALTARGYEVTPLIGTDVKPEDVVSALFSQAWQIVHIAAHGVVDFRFPSDPLQEPKTGVVIGGSMVLDAEILEQMPMPPDLFFVNCCLLGTIEPTEENEHLRSQRPALASSVAVQLIKMGVRAVVAAGWEVSDRSAELFAKQVYDGLLNGGAFGDVVRQARSDVHSNYSRDSTWGAYQCYGHPDFRLRTVIPDKRHKPEDRTFASPNEAKAAIERIAALSEVGRERAQSEDLAELEHIEGKVVEFGWLGRADVRGALAGAYAELNRFDKAIDHYANAALAEDASVPIRAIEQQLNIQARMAVSHAAAMAEDGDRRRDAAEKIGRSIDKLSKLVDISGETLERLSLLGGSYKRLAQVTSGDERTENLESMAEFYGRARAIGQERGVANVYYPWCQELSAQVVLRLRGERVDKPDFASFRKLSLPPGKDDFWLQALPADLVLLERVSDRTITDQDQDEIVDAYLRVWHHIGSKRELSSILDQLAFFIEMLGDAAKVGKAQETRLEKLQALRDRLERDTQS